MGIKENFTQAVKELTGIGGKEKETAGSNVDTVEGLKKAVNDAPSQEAREISLDTGKPLDWPVPDWDGSETSTIRPIPTQSAQQEPQMPTEPEMTPAAEQFLSGASAPISLFGQPTQQNQPQETTYAQPQQPAQAAPPVSDATSFFSQQPQQHQHQQSSQSFAQPPPQSQQAQQSSQSFTQPPPQQRPSALEPRPMGIHGDNELTIISRNTVIDGNVRSFSDMSIDGSIKGDVETTKNIDLNGTIIGNISCNNAMMHASQIQGNVRMKGNISMKRDTLLIGDLMSTYAEVNGKIKGNLDVVGKADLKGDAVVFGDISASTVAIEDGAIIQGYLNTTFLNKEESKKLFPDAVVINSEAEEPAS